MPTVLHLLLVLAALVVQSQSLNEISCKDNDGNDVDWFVAHKLPKIRSYDQHVPPNLSYGGYYRYFVASDPESKWRPADYRNIDNELSMIGHTLLQARLARVVTVAYNDQPPEGTTPAREGRAHAKGTLLINMNTGAGVWLLHSVPRFVNIRKLRNGEYEYPSTGLKNGQSFLCLTIDSAQMDNVGKHLYNMRAHVFDSAPAELVPWVQGYSPWLFRVLNNDFTSPSPGSDFSIKTSRNMAVGLFSKTKSDSGSAGDFDIWAHKVAPSVQTSIIVQSWQCGGGSMLPEMTHGNYVTRNIERVFIPWNKGVPPHLQKWYSSPTKDHSKFAVGDGDASSIVCIGDMNRRTTQTVRGGGAACFAHHRLWTAYWSMLTPTFTSSLVDYKQKFLDLQSPILSDDDQCDDNDED